MSPKKLKCPFCSYSEIKIQPGYTRCSKCHSNFEIDDRGECIFVDIRNAKLPQKGIFCPFCGLIQCENTLKCALCGVDLANTIQ